VKKRSSAPESRLVPDRERGAILIVVLWVILAVSLLAISFSASIRTEVDAARNVVEQKQAYYLARAGIEYAVYEVLEVQSAFYQSERGVQQDLDVMPDVMRGLVTLRLSGGTAVVEIGDETGKINVNQVPDHLIFNLLIMIGVESSQADVITDSIMDWIDPDDFVRGYGAESAYYQSLDPPYFARNSFFEVPEELLLIQGVTPAIYYGKKGLTDSGDPIEYYGLQNYLTTFSASGRINVNSAPAAVLAAIPGLDYSSAVAIEAMRREMPLIDLSEISQVIPGLSGEALGHLAILQSNIYSIRSKGVGTGSNATSQIRAVVRVDGSGPKGYAILYWNESNMEM
jgi:general secretion pathway protein K